MGGAIGGGIIGGVIGFATGGPVGAVIGAGAGYASGREGELAGDAADRQKRALQQQSEAIKSEVAANQHALEVQNRQQQILARTSRVEAIRKARSLAGTMIASGAASGVGSGSSSLQGGLSSLQSQIASNVGTSNALTSLEDERVSSLNDAAGFASTAATAQGRYTAAGLDYSAAVTRADSYGKIGYAGVEGWNKVNTPKFKQAFTNIFR